MIPPHKKIVGVALVLILLAIVFMMVQRFSKEYAVVEKSDQVVTKAVTDPEPPVNLAQASSKSFPKMAPMATPSVPKPKLVIAITPPVTPPKPISVAPAGASTGATLLSGCQVFPRDNPWNTDISSYPVHPNSAAYVASIGGSGHLHADFGGNGEYGIPFTVVPQGAPRVPITFTAYGDESDAGPYPVPLTAPVEGGASSDGDRHVLVLEQGVCKLYELYRSFQVGQEWNADSGAVYDLGSNKLRADYWTSADAAGLPILPGLVRYDEVAAGAVTHAIRFTVQRTQKGFIHPATHYASNRSDASLPPMGLRMRLRADFDISKFMGQSRVILEGMKKYGIILADNGSNWYLTGAADPRWNDDDLNQLKTVPGSAFEAVDTGGIIH